MLHSDLSLSQNHPVHDWKFQSEIEREASITSNAVTTSDIGKVALQLNDNSFWILNSKPIQPFTTTYTDPTPIVRFFANLEARDTAFYTLTDVKVLVGVNYVNKLWAVDKQTGIVWTVVQSSLNNDPPIWKVYSTPIQLTSAQIEASTLTLFDLNQTNKSLVWNVTTDVLKVVSITVTPIGPLRWDCLSYDESSYIRDWNDAIHNGNYFDNGLTSNRPGNLAGSYFGTTLVGRSSGDHPQIIQTVYHFTGGASGFGITKVYQRRTYTDSITLLRAWSTWSQGSNVLSLSFSNSSDRLNANLTLDDIGKIVKQASDGSIWIVSDVIENGVSPGVNAVTWAPLGGAVPALVSNSTARKALSFTTQDVGLLVHQTNTGAYYIVEDISPSVVATWTQLPVLRFDTDVMLHGSTVTDITGYTYAYAADTNKAYKAVISSNNITWTEHLVLSVADSTSLKDLILTTSSVGVVAINPTHTTLWEASITPYVTKLLNTKPVLTNPVVSSISEDMANHLVLHTTVPNDTINILSDSTLNLPVGTTVDFVITGTDALTFVADTGVTILSEFGLVTTGADSLVKATKIGSNKWKLEGDLTGSSFPLKAKKSYTSSAARTTPIATIDKPVLGTIAVQTDESGVSYWSLKDLVETAPSSGLWTPTWSEIGANPVAGTSIVTNWDTALSTGFYSSNSTATSRPTSPVSSSNHFVGTVSQMYAAGNFIQAVYEISNMDAKAVALHTRQATVDGGGMGVNLFTPWVVTILGDPLVSFNAQLASYALQDSDASTVNAMKYVTISNGAANTVTVSPNLIGDTFNIIQEGAGQTTLVPGVGVTLKGTPGLKFRAQYSAVTLVKQETNVYYVIGDLSA